MHYRLHEKIIRTKILRQLVYMGRNTTEGKIEHDAKSLVKVFDISLIHAGHTQKFYKGRGASHHFLSTTQYCVVTDARFV